MPTPKKKNRISIAEYTRLERFAMQHGISVEEVRGEAKKRFRVELEEIPQTGYISLFRWLEQQVELRQAAAERRAAGAP